MVSSVSVGISAVSVVSVKLRTKVLAGWKLTEPQYTGTRRRTTPLEER